MTIEEYLETQSPATRAECRSEITLYRCRMIWQAAKRDAAKEILDHLGSATFWADGPDAMVVRDKFIKEFITSNFDVEI